MDSEAATATALLHPAAETADEDDPRFSSAALCIQLNLLGQSFGPEYTHQCFPGEFIRGYQPRNSILGSITSSPIQQQQHYHKSHEHHEQATHELDIQIHLAPSCRTCHLAIATQKRRRMRPKRTTSKRPRLDNENENDKDSKYIYEDDEGNTFSSSSSTDSTEEYVDSEEDIDNEEDDARLDDNNSDQQPPLRSTRTRRMPVSEIRECLRRALPEIVESAQKNFLTRPVGQVLEEYSRNGMDFCVTLANGTDDGVADYHAQVQKLALFFIETAEDVNVDNSRDGGSWKILYLFRKHKRKSYSLAGYMTLFYFTVPFHKPQPGTIVRICQVLVLPPYQRAGHGRTLLHAVYEHVAANNNNPDIVEINVEDPAPAFTRLRNAVDYERFVQNKSNWLPQSTIASSSTIDDNDFFAPLTERQAMEAAARAKITPRQMHIVYELDKLQCLEEYLEQKPQRKKQQVLQKKYRLMVKKRLNKWHREELSSSISTTSTNTACGGKTKQELQQRLAELFEECMGQYKMVLRQYREEKRDL